MVSGDPLNIIIVTLGAGFLLPLFYKWNKYIASAVFYLTLAYITVLAGEALLTLLRGYPPFEMLTAGLPPPLSINLRLGLHEAIGVAFVNLVGLLGGWYLFKQASDHVGKQVLFLILIMGIDGMIMTRDLFNLFIFIEITAIATYGMIAMEDSANSLIAGFKYVVATSLASTFFLLGTILFYFLTGTLNIDDMMNYQAQLVGPLATAGGVLLLTALLVELKPYPANGWGLDVYQATQPGMAAMISVGVSTGVLFALYKVLPLLKDYLPIIYGIGLFTFFASNVMGLRQNNPQRLLGYSSIGQIALTASALAIIIHLAAKPLGSMEMTIALIVGGLFVNHFLAKAALFWLAGIVKRDNIEHWTNFNGLQKFLFGSAIAALAGFPPFPAFWAKWELLMQMAAAHMGVWMAVILLGSLLEAAYLYRWFGHTLKQSGETPANQYSSLTPVIIFIALLYACGYAAGLVADINWLSYTGISLELLFVPLLAGALLFLFDGLPVRIKGSFAVLILAAYAYQVLSDLSGIDFVFALMLSAAGVVIAFASLYRNTDKRPGFYPLLVILVMSLGALVQANVTLEFFFAWEIMTLSSYLLLCRGKDAGPHLLNYILFSLGSAFFILSGFAVAYAETASTAVVAMQQAENSAWLIWLLLGIGFVIKVGALGTHIWVPGAYSEAEDDFSAMLSAVVSKAAIFGLMLAAINLPLQGQNASAVSYVLGWVGLITAFGGALMAVFQEDMKRLLAYSSIGQVGYIVTAVAMMSHTGWTTALYLSLNHVFFKGLLFLAIAGVIYRTGTRMMYETGGLIKKMPLSFVAALVGIFAISGVPPMSGFGGKWLLYNALFEKGWYLQAGLAFAASAIAFLYLFRLIFTIFLGQAKPKHKDVTEAPWILIIPQAILLLGVMTLSMAPKLILEPLAQIVAAATTFPATMQWEGLSLVTEYGYWNNFIVVCVSAGVIIVPLLFMLFMNRYIHVQPVKQFNMVYAAERPHTPETTHYAYNFYSFYKRAMGFLVEPKATAFWDGVAEWMHTLAGMLRGLYTGSGQTYALYIVLFLVAIYFSAGAV